MMLIGIGIGTVGLAVHLAMDDPMLLILSLILTVCCMLKTILLGRTILKKQYIIMEGRCLSTAPLPFSRFSQVVLRGDDGEEHVCRLEKRMKIRVGQQLTLYFAVLPRCGFGVTGIDALIQTDSLLGTQLNN